MPTTGAEVKVGYAFTNTWGQAASVTKQLLMSSTEGMEDGTIQLVDDDSFNQDFRMEAEGGDKKPAQFELSTQARFEVTDALFAASMGSPAAPAVVSSNGANSSVAYRHVIDLSKALTHMMTVAVDMKNYVVEIPSARVKGFTLKVGDNGRMMVSFPMVGAYTEYASTVNTNSTVAGAAAAGLGNRLFRKNATFRMNPQVVAGSSGGASLTATDAYGAILREMTLTYTRVVAEDDNVFGQDYIISPDDNDFATFGLDLTFARMSSTSANSLALGLKNITTFKGDLTYTGVAINTTTSRSFLLQFPAMQIASFKAPAAGHQQVRPTVSFKLAQASAAPTGMVGVTLPMRLTIVNCNSAQLGS